MIKVLIAVIDDLVTFAVDSLTRPFKKFTGATENEHPKEGDVAKVELPSALLRENEVDVEPSVFKKVGDIFSAEKKEQVFAAGKNTVMYVGTMELPVYMKPTLEFDGVIDELSYGDLVIVLEQQGRWAHVVSGTCDGWVLREDLVDRAAHVYPKFVIGEKNDADDPNTYRVRAMLKDTFSGGRAEMPLQSGEYVAYRLLRKGLTLPWSDERPRLPGRWHKLLKGATGIHVGVTPKTGAIIEYVAPEEIGHLAYVEAVFPDETINISEVNYPDFGIYNERVLTREEWRELKPVFIQVM